MRHLKWQLIFTVGLLFISIDTKAQQSLNASGGEAVSNSGEVSFSIGETFYIYKNSNEGTLSEGVQQAYEITDETTSISDLKIKLEAKVFPNPTDDFLILAVDNQTKNLHFKLTDLNGKIIFNQKILNTETVLNMQSLASGIYFLNIENEYQLLQTFKIVKIK